MQNVAIIGPADMFIAVQQDAHCIDYRWNKKTKGYELDKRADSVKIEVAKILARLKRV